MTWLLDTHTLLWALFDPAKLGRKSRAILSNQANRVYVSPVSYWEISLKHGMGKLKLPKTMPEEIPDAARAMGLAEDPLASDMLASIHLLPYAPGHRDPFDRMIVWHCIRSRHVLLSKNRAMLFFRDHGLRHDW